MSATLDQRATMALTAWQAKDAERICVTDEAVKDRLKYVKLAMEAGWSWRRIGKGHRTFFERHRQEIGRIPS